MNYHELARALIEVGDRVARQVHYQLNTQTSTERSAVVSEHADDTIYQIDEDIHTIVFEQLNKVAPSLGGLVLIAEGFDEGLVLPNSMPRTEAAWQVLIDPIDGTRGIMYDKRSAFFLAGAAPNQDNATGLNDLEVSVMVEIPTSRSTLSDRFWAIRGLGVQGKTHCWRDEIEMDRSVCASFEKSIYGGFAQLAKFFHPGKDILTSLEARLVEQLFPDAPAGRAFLFDDQYISTGGQLYEMILGRDRFIADIRGGLNRRLRSEGKNPALTCHPYDMAGWLVAREAGVIVTGLTGEPINAPLDTTSAADWIAYANASIRSEVEPVLQELMKEFGFIDS